MFIKEKFAKSAGLRQVSRDIQFPLNMAAIQQREIRCHGLRNPIYLCGVTAELFLAA
jgi:hypothetical protein